MRRYKLIASLVVLALVASTPVRAAEQLPAPTCGADSLYCLAATHNDLAAVLDDYPAPSVAPPRTQFADTTFAVSRPVSRAITYSVAINGAVGVDLATLQKQVQAILSDSRGWTRLGVRFEQVQTGGSFTFVLAEPAKVPSYGAPCDTVWNCNVGNYVIANNARWMGATDPWNVAGGTIGEYRHLTVNHELGHWLGHGHRACSGAGQAAGVMQQQSMDLQGCKFNPWPLDTELTSSRLGI